MRHSRPNDACPMEGAPPRAQFTSVRLLHLSSQLPSHQRRNETLRLTVPSSAMLRTMLLALALVAMTMGSGCALWGHRQSSGVAVANPFFIASSNQEVVWERVVDVLHDYRFEIARENRLDGVIETDYKVGSSCLEPWHTETVGFENRLESTLQSIRRRATVSLVPAEGGYLVQVEVFQEIEDVPGGGNNSPGGATFQESAPLQRDLELVVGQTAPSGWIPQGRDPALEQDMLHRLNGALTR